MANSNIEVLEKNTTKVFFKYTTLHTISLIAISSAGIVDAYFIGQFVGQIELAATNIIVPMYSFVFAFVIMLTVGGAVRASKYIGEGNRERASVMFSMSFFGGLIFSIILAIVILIFSENIAIALGSDETLLPLSKLYLSIISPAFVIGSLSYILSSFTRVANKPYLASLALTLNLPINVFLDWLFIVHYGYGIAGAALATTLAPIIPTLMLLIYFASGKAIIGFTKNIRSIKELLISCYNGFPQLLSEASFGVVAFLFNRIMMSFAGPSGVAGFTFINYAVWGYSMLAYAIGESLVPLISTNLGARKPERIKSFLRLGVIIVFFIGIGGFVVSSLMPETMVAVFLPDRSSDGFLIGVEFLSYVRWSFLILGLNIVLTSYFTAMHRPKEALILALARGGFFPVILLLTLPLIFDQIGVYLAIPVTNIFTLIICIVLLKYNKVFKMFGKK